MSWTFITVTFIQDVYIFKKYSTQRQLLKTGRLLKTQEYILSSCYFNVLATLMLYISQVRPNFLINDNVSSRFFGHSKLGVVVLVINGFHYRPLNLLNTRTEISCKTRSIIYLGSYRSYYRVEKIVISLCGS